MKKKINSKFMLISAIAIIVMAICAMVLFYDILKKQICDLHDEPGGSAG